MEFWRHIYKRNGRETKTTKDMKVTWGKIGERERADIAKTIGRHEGKVKN